MSKTRLATLDDTGNVPASQLGNAGNAGVTKQGVIDTGVTAADLGGVAVTELGAASGVATLGADGKLTPSQAPASGGSKASVVSVPYASTITPALSTSQVTIFDVGTITGPLTVDAPTGTPFDGQIAWFRFQQDATGHAVTFQTGSSGQYHFRSLVTQSSIPTTPNAPFDVLFGYSAETAFFEALAINY